MIAYLIFRGTTPPLKIFSGIAQVSILSADTNSDSDTDSIDTGIDASGILDYPGFEYLEWSYVLGPQASLGPFDIEILGGQ